MKWEKEFDEEFFIKNGKAMTSGLKTADNIKQFISTQIEKAKQEERERILNIIENEKGNYFLRSQGAESEGVYLNKIDIIKRLLT